MRPKVYSTCPENLARVFRPVPCVERRIEREERKHVGVVSGGWHPIRCAGLDDESEDEEHLTASSYARDWLDKQRVAASRQLREGTLVLDSFVPHVPPPPPVACGSVIPQFDGVQTTPPSAETSNVADQLELCDDRVEELQWDEMSDCVSPLFALTAEGGAQDAESSGEDWFQGVFGEPLNINLEHDWPERGRVYNVTERLELAAARLNVDLGGPLVERGRVYRLGDALRHDVQDGNVYRLPEWVRRLRNRLYPRSSS